jgi:hypothetical protein
VQLPTQAAAQDHAPRAAPARGKRVCFLPSEDRRAGTCQIVASLRAGLVSHEPFALDHHDRLRSVEPGLGAYPVDVVAAKHPTRFNAPMVAVDAFGYALAMQRQANLRRHRRTSPGHQDGAQPLQIRAALAITVLTVGAALGPGCSPSPRATSTAATVQPRIGAPLPSGWVWPFNLATVAKAFDPYTIYRPIDVSALLALHRSGPCAPVEVAPNVWIQPLCTRLPRIAAWEDMWTNGGSDKALVREQEWPYDPVKACELQAEQDDCDQAYHVQRGGWRNDPQLVAEKQRADGTGTWRIATVEKLSARPADPNQIASVVASGQAIYVGMDIDTRAFQNKNVRDGVISDYASGESGHALVIVGYRPSGATRQFLIHNSWGTDWGDRGYAWISEAMVSRFTHQAFVISVAARGAPAPTPPSPGPPTPTSTVRPPSLPTAWPFPLPGLPGVPGGSSPASGTCENGQARDMVFGSCSKACPGGSPPVAGFCPASPPASPAPAPAPVPTVPTGGCSAGQVRDWLTGSCVAQCANGLPPAGGACLP